MKLGNMIEYNEERGQGNLTLQTGIFTTKFENKSHCPDI